LLEDAVLVSFALKVTGQRGFGFAAYAPPTAAKMIRELCPWFGLSPSDGWAKGRTKGTAQL
jgi:hypothetical protein